MVWLSLEEKCNIHLQDSVKDALRERQDSVSWPTAYMCSNLLYEMQSTTQTTSECLLKFPGKNAFLHATLAFFWFRPVYLFELGCMNHHIQNVSLICIFKYFSFQNGMIIPIIHNLFWKNKTSQIAVFCSPQTPKNCKSWNLNVEGIRDVSYSQGCPLLHFKKVLRSY